MSRAELLQILAALAGACASIVAAVEARLVKNFTKAGATSPQQAWEPPPLTKMSRWKLTRLVSVGAIVEASPGCYYLDTGEYRQFRKKRRVRALMVLVFLAATAAIAVLMFAS